MAIDLNKSFEVNQYGVALVDDNGSTVCYITSGSGAPTNITAPINTFYIDSSTQKIHYKYGSADTAWRQLRAEDIAATDPNLLPTTVAAELTRIGQGGGTGVAQTLIYGGGGNTAQNSYLSNNNVPSNVVGVPVGLSNAKIRSVFLGNENIKTGNILIQQRTPAGTGTWTTIYTLALSNQSYKTVTGLNITVTTGAEVAVFTGVSLKNVKVVVNVNGDSS